MIQNQLNYSVASGPSRAEKDPNSKKHHVPRCSSKNESFSLDDQPSTRNLINAALSGLNKTLSKKPTENDDRFKSSFKKAAIDKQTVGINTVANQASSSNLPSSSRDRTVSKLRQPSILHGVGAGTATLSNPYGSSNNG
jgi:hypothetical protein